MFPLLKKLRSITSGEAKLASDAAIITGSFAGSQFLRLANSVVLARLLTPELFGVMAIVNTVRQGVMLLSDLGTNQSIIKSDIGAKPDFYNTAWTIAAIRGILLWLVCLAAAGPIASFYDAEVLSWSFPLIALTVLMSGFASSSLPLLLRAGRAKTRSLFMLSVSIVTVSAHIIAAFFTPTIWVFVIGNFVSEIYRVTGSHLLFSGVKNRFYFSKTHFKEIFDFGKWLLLSSVIVFAALQVDKVILGKLIPLSFLGIYALSRTIAELPVMSVRQLGSSLIFPLISRADKSDRPALRKLIQRPRLTLLLLSAVGLAIVIAVSDIAFGLIFDERYAKGAAILPILLIQAWISIICTINGSLLMGLGKPSYLSGSDGLKLACLIVAIPITFAIGGLTGVLWAMVVCELCRYCVLLFGQFKERIHFVKQDLTATTVFAVSVFCFLQARALLGAPFTIGGPIIIT